MSSLFDAPAHLMIVLAAAVSGQVPADAPPLDNPRAAMAEQGPYAFSDNAWLAAVRQGFGGADTTPFRDRIFATSGGRVYVPVQTEKQDILAGRQNATMARAVAVDLAKFHVAELRSLLGHDPGVKDVYAAHMFGLDVSARLAGLRASKPDTLVASALPEITDAYPEAAMRRGVALTIADLYRRLPDAQDTATNTAANVVIEPLNTGVRGLVIGAPLPLHADRAAPLRGVIKDAVQPEADAVITAKAAQVAGLETPPPDWTTEVRRAQ